MSILKIENLLKTFPASNGANIRALNGINLELKAGETLGLVGESGSGKSTLAKILMQLESPSHGSLLLEQKPFDHYSKKDFYSHIQMVFQDPFSSLNPRKNIFSLITEPLRIQGGHSVDELKDIALKNLKLVGLEQSYLKAYPHTLSGGQRQRIGIARALTLNPKVLILDEPISALDVSIQASILNLLNKLQKELGLTYLFIGHDLNVIRYLSDRVAVMYLGEIVECAKTEELFESPLHPYTQALMNSSLNLKEDKQISNFYTLTGEIPSPLAPPSGCPFHNRCPKATELCSTKVPPTLNLSEEHFSSCYIP